MTHCESGYTEGLCHMKQHTNRLAKRSVLKKGISETAVLISIFKAH